MDGIPNRRPYQKVRLSSGLCHCSFYEVAGTMQSRNPRKGKWEKTKEKGLGSYFLLAFFSLLFFRLLFSPLITAVLLSSPFSRSSSFSAKSLRASLRFCSRERVACDLTTIPVGIWRSCTAEFVLLTMKRKCFFFPFTTLLSLFYSFPWGGTGKGEGKGKR